MQMTENIFHDISVQKFAGALAIVLSIIGYVLIALLVLQWLAL